MTNKDAGPAKQPGIGAELLQSLTNDLRLAKRLFFDNEIKLKEKILPGALVTAGLLYVVSPLDLIPDVIPVLGQLDDAFVAWAILHIGVPHTFRAEHVRRHRIAMAMDDNVRWGSIDEDLNQARPEEKKPNIKVGTNISE